MQESLHKFMKVGIIHFMAYPNTMKGEGPILDTVKKIAVDDYFDVVEISWIKDPEARKAVKKALDTAHMTVAYGGQPRLLTQGLNINDTDEDGRKKALATLIEGIDEAYEMGAAGFAFLSGKYEAARLEDAYQALLKSTRELCAYAKSKGNLKIVHEVFDFDIDKKSLIGPASLAKRYAADIRKEYDNFGLMVDLSHLPLIRESAKEAILPIKEYLVHAHIGNCVVKSKDLPAYGDQHPRFGFPGGENDTAEVIDYLKVLLEIGFLNEKNPPILSFEVKPVGDEDPDLVVANAKRVLNRAWALL
jgi:sugar phosphate isomerase/epimerase